MTFPRTQALLFFINMMYITQRLQKLIYHVPETLADKLTSLTFVHKALPCALYHLIPGQICIIWCTLLYWKYCRILAFPAIYCFHYIAYLAQNTLIHLLHQLENAWLWQSPHTWVNYMVGTTFHYLLSIHVKNSNTVKANCLYIVYSDECVRILV